MAIDGQPAAGRGLRPAPFYDSKEGGAQPPSRRLARSFGDMVLFIAVMRSGLSGFRWVGLRRVEFREGRGVALTSNSYALFLLARAARLWDAGEYGDTLRAGARWR